MMNIDILNKFTTHLRNTLVKASDYAQEWGHTQVKPEHLVYSLLQQKGSIGMEILQKAGLDAERVKDYIIRTTEMLPPDIEREEITTQLSDTAKECVTRTGIVARSYNHTYIGTEHLLSCLTDAKTDTLHGLFAEEHVNVPELRQHVSMVLKSTSKFPDLTEVFGSPSPRPTGTSEQKSKTPSLDFFCSDLTSEHIQKHVDPVIGRDDEIERLIHILSRRTKNNPVLIGDPGVGKTAIVEGLAKRIVNGDVPDVLSGKRMLALDLGLVVAGTMYRGEFEGRFKQILDEIRQDPNIILFIDELHTIIGTGGAAGSLDAANILKPALARGDVRCIGATTMDEYRKHIESDAALERRFQPIIVGEPSVDETKEILKGLKENYETFHRVSITDEAIDAAAELSARYVQDKFLPDKAIDVIDEAASRLKVSAGTDVYSREIAGYQSQLDALEDDKRTAVSDEDFKKAIGIKTKEEDLRNCIDRVRERRAQASDDPLGEVGRKDVAYIIARHTRIPVEDLISEERDRLLKLEQTIGKRIVGQNEAIATVAGYIRRARAGLSNPNRPLGSFIFLGPSGVGKTELAKVITEEVFGSIDSLIRIDMSEFSESFQSSKLIGAPAGYVGYKDGGKLTESVRRRPYSVVLFDEIEKAHPDIFNLFLQIFEDGTITDAVGKAINFRNTIIIMTSNVGLKDLRSLAMGFGEASGGTTDESAIRDQVLHELKETFRPEFLNRIDSTIVFHPLSLQNATAIAALQIDELNRRLKPQGITIRPDKTAVRWIAQRGFSADQGARSIRQVIQDHIENPLAEALLNGTRKRGMVKITVDRDALRFV